MRYLTLCAILCSLASCRLHDLAPDSPNRLTMAASISTRTHSTDGASDVDVDSQAVSLSYGRLIDGTSLEPGLKLFVANSSIDVDDGDDIDQTDLAVAGSLRYYFIKDQPVRPFVEGFGGFAYSKFDFGDGDNNSDTGPIFGGSVGIMAFLTPAASFQLDLTYTYLDVSEVETDDFSVNAGISIHW